MSSPAEAHCWVDHKLHEEVCCVVLGMEAPYWLSYGQFGSAQKKETNKQTNRIANYIIVRYEVWTVVLGLEAPYWLSYGQFGYAQKKARDKQTDRQNCKLYNSKI